MEVDMVVVAVDGNRTEDDQLLSELWGTSSRSCRVVILHITQSGIIENRKHNDNSKNKNIISDNNKQSMMVALR